MSSLQEDRRRDNQRYRYDRERDHSSSEGRREREDNNGYNKSSGGGRHERGRKPAGKDSNSSTYRGKSPNNNKESKRKSNNNNQEKKNRGSGAEWGFGKRKSKGLPRFYSLVIQTKRELEREREKDLFIEELEDEVFELKGKVAELRNRLRKQAKQLQKYEADYDSGTSSDEETTPHQKKPFGNTRLTRDAKCFLCQRVTPGKQIKNRVLVVTAGGICFLRRYSEVLKEEYSWSLIPRWSFIESENKLIFHIVSSHHHSEPTLHYYSVPNVREVNLQLLQVIKEVAHGTTNEPASKQTNSKFSLNPWKTKKKEKK